MRGFFIGRFQPYHLGHHYVILKILEEIDELVIGIGSAQESHSLQNPFTAGERMLMVSKALEEIKTDKKAYVVPLEDIYRNSLWVPHVQSMIPPIDVVFSNNPLVRRLFSEAGYEIKRTDLRNRNEYQGTEIRKRILEGGDWEELVPQSVARIIVEIHGIERLKEVSGNDAG
ncbi:MAG: nicotinamide-nucleotide adenylyltransferase [Archaeoglobaceae archaeon]